jgi:hypothetical protein
MLILPNFAPPAALSFLAQPAKESASEKTDITAAAFFKAAKTFSDLNLCDITVASFFE